jgi:hypothetical protein
VDCGGAGPQAAPSEAKGVLSTNSPLFDTNNTTSIVPRFNPGADKSVSYFWHLELKTC